MKHFDAIISLALRIGVLLSAALFFIGLIFSYSLLMTLGVFVLLSTPVIRVILSVILFVQLKNKLYITITSIVLINLLIAIFLLPFLLR